VTSTERETDERFLRIGLASEFVYPFRKGGAEKRFYEVARRLARRGHEMHWFGMYEWPGPAHVEVDGIHVHAGARPFEVYGENGQRAILPTLRLGASLSTALAHSRVRFDLLDLSLYPFFHIFGARLLRPRTRLVVSWHEYWGDHWHEYMRSRAAIVGVQIERFAARVPDFIIATSDLARDGLVSSGVPESQVATIHNGVAVADVEAVAPADGNIDFVFFGRLKNHKNVDLLLRAFALARRMRPELTCLVVGHGPEYNRLLRLAGELDLGNCVRFTGAIPSEEEMLSRVKSSRVYVNPSTKEGGGSITLLEAYACGLPAIVVRHPLGIDDSLVRNGETGWWAAAPEPEALAATMLEAVADEDRLRRMRDAVRRFVRQYDWDEVASQCESRYRAMRRRDPFSRPTGAPVARAR